MKENELNKGEEKMEDKIEKTGKDLVKTESPILTQKVIGKVSGTLCTLDNIPVYITTREKDKSERK